MLKFKRNSSDFLLLRLFRNGQFSKVIVHKSLKLLRTVNGKKIKASKVVVGDILGSGYTVIDKIQLTKNSLLDNLQPNTIYSLPDLNLALQELKDTFGSEPWEPSEDFLKKYFIEEISRFMIGVRIRTIFNEDVYLSGELLTMSGFYINYDQLSGLGTLRILESL